MADNLLYYPYIAVPESPWINRTLLYWDHIGSIMPFDQAVNTRLDPFTSKLMNERLLVPIYPEEYLGESDELVNEFDLFLEHDPATPGYQQAFRQTSMSSEVKSLPLLHHSKVGYRLGHVLASRGLATRSDNRWHRVEPNTALNFMALLASALSCHPSLRSQSGLPRYTPGTDMLDSLHRTKNIIERLGLRDSIRQVVLNDLLPVPVGGVTPYGIRQFKETHGQQLRSFRNAIELFALEASADPDKASRHERTLRFKEAKHDEIEELSGRMRSQGWRVIGGVFATIIAATAQVSEKLQQHDAVHAAFSTLGLLGALSTTHALLRQRKVAYAPMAYAALVQHQYPARPTMYRRN